MYAQGVERFAIEGMATQGDPLVASHSTPMPCDDVEHMVLPARIPRRDGPDVLGFRVGVPPGTCHARSAVIRRDALG